MIVITGLLNTCYLDPELGYQQVTERKSFKKWSLRAKIFYLKMMMFYDYVEMEVLEKMKCQEFTQKEFYKKANEIFKECVKNHDIDKLEELFNTVTILLDMNFIKNSMAYKIYWNILQAKMIITNKEKINKEHGYDKQ